MTLKLGIKYRIVLKTYKIDSNDHTGLTLSRHMIWSNLFPNASARVKADKAYSHIFPSLFLFSITYALR